MVAGTKSRWLRRTGLIGVAVSILLGSYFGYRYLRSKPVNVLVITLDTTRADRFRCYGYKNGQTPKIDGLASEGIVFDRAYSTVPLTLPSHASILTGLYPPEHGLRVNGRDKLSSGPETLAGILSAHGYSTGAFVSSFVLDRKFGLDRGFQHYDDSRGQEGAQGTGTAAGVTTAALDWLRGNADSPFLCWVHYIDPHAEYDPHTELFGNQFRDVPYDGEIAYVDLHVGKLLQFLKDRGVDDRTLVIIVGDHGEAFGEHGERTHGSLVYNTTMQVPFVMRAPREEKYVSDKFVNRHVEIPVSQVDILPTILDFLGLVGSDARKGISLLPVLNGSGASDRGIYFESLAMTPRGWAPQQGMIRKQWKFVHSPRSQLFDLSTDTREDHNLIESQPLVRSEMKELLNVTEKKFQLHRGEGTLLTPAEKSRLAAGGYADALVDQNSLPDSAPDVKDMLPYYYQTLDAEMLIPKSPATAESTLRKVVKDQPEFEMAWSVLGAALHAQGKIEDAIVAMTRANGLDPKSVRVHTTLGKIKRAQHKLAEAESEFRSVLQIRPDDMEVRLQLADILVETGQLKKAVSELRMAAESKPEDVQIRVALANALLKNGDTDQAREQAEYAVTLNPRSFDAQLQLGLVFNAQGATSAAIDQYRKTIPLSPPKEIRAHLHLANALWKSAQKVEARSTLQQALKRVPDSQKARDLLKTFDG